jgi:hypothetical protein
MSLNPPTHECADCGKLFPINDRCPECRGTIVSGIDLLAGLEARDTRTTRRRCYVETTGAKATILNIVEPDVAKLPRLSEVSLLDRLYIEFGVRVSLCIRKDEVIESVVVEGLSADMDAVTITAQRLRDARGLLHSLKGVGTRSMAFPDTMMQVHAILSGQDYYRSDAVPEDNPVRKFVDAQVRQFSKVQTVVYNELLDCEILRTRSDFVEEFGDGPGSTWLFSTEPEDKGTGRTTALVVGFVAATLQYPGAWIYYHDHRATSRTDERGIYQQALADAGILDYFEFKLSRFRCVPERVAPEVESEGPDEKPSETPGGGPCSTEASEPDADPSALLTAVQDLLCELRINPDELQAMAAGFSPDYPGQEYATADHARCRVQLSKTTAKKLLNAGVAEDEEVHMNGLSLALQDLLDELGIGVFHLDTMPRGYSPYYAAMPEVEGSKQHRVQLSQVVARKLWKAWGKG